MAEHHSHTQCMASILRLASLVCYHAYLCTEGLGCGRQRRAATGLGGSSFAGLQVREYPSE
jgi:hypothetical protein